MIDLPLRPLEDVLAEKPVGEFIVLCVSRDNLVDDWWSAPFETLAEAKEHTKTLQEMKMSCWRVVGIAQIVSRV